jgi:hypothetical protein
MEALDDPIRLRALHAGLAVLDTLELEEQLVGMAVGPTAELAAIVREHVIPCAFEQQSMALQVDLADALQVPDEERVDSHEIASVMGLDMAFAELGAEAFKCLDLLFRPREGALGGGLLQPQQTCAGSVGHAVSTRRERRGHAGLAPLRLLTVRGTSPAPH